jgi:hypothetical protein
MTVDKVSSALTQRSQLPGSSFFFSGQDDIASKLTIGQVIEAKVMRHHEGGRYSVNFNGQEKIVDSANPLRLGELIQGRVKSLGQQIEIQRVNTAVDQYKEQSAAKTINETHLFSQKNDRPLNQIKAFFTQNQSSLSSAELLVVRNLIGKVYPLNVIAMSALAVKKAGIEVTREPVVAVAKSLVGDFSENKNTSIISHAAILAVEHNVVDSLVDPLLIKELADEIKQYAHLAGNDDSHVDLSESASTSTSDDPPEQSNRYLADWLLNVQDDSSMNHRLMTFPIWMGNKLIEIRMAFFDQDKSRRNEQDIDVQYKRAVFTVDFECLGSVVISAVMHGVRMSLNVASEKSDTTDYIAQHMGNLKKTVETMGWVVEQLEYATVSVSELEAATEAVVKHYISKDSVSRLL